MTVTQPCGCRYRTTQIFDMPPVDQLEWEPVILCWAHLKPVLEAMRVER